MLPSLNTIAEQQANPTHNTEYAITHFLDYAATNTSVIVQFKANDMVIHIDRVASYLLEPQSRSCIAGKYFLSSLTDDPSKYPNLPPLENVPIHT